MAYETRTSSIGEPKGIDRAFMAAAYLQSIAEDRAQLDGHVEDPIIRVTTFDEDSRTYHDIDWHQPDDTPEIFPRLTLIRLRSSQIECFALIKADTLNYLPFSGGAPITKGPEGIDVMADKLEELVADLGRPGSNTEIELIDIRQPAF
jgi:hypothetical protein